jgi:drug/metabolite transporter (DMT)-like permease
MSKWTLPPRVALFITVVLWGSGFVATKAALREVSPVTLIVVRFALGTSLLLWLVRLRSHNLVPPRGDWPTLALMGFMGIFVHQLLQAVGLTMATAVHTGWLIGLIPIWSALLSALLLKERFGALKLAGLAGGFAGAVLVISQGKLGLDQLRLPSTHGDFLILLSTVNWAVYSVIGHGTIKRLGPLRATAGSMFLGWLMFLPLFLYQGGWRELAHVSGTGWGALLFLGIGCSGVGYWCWYGALERIELSRVAAFLYIEPPVTLLTAVILLHEPVSAITAAGGVLVLLSVYVMQRAPS